MTFLFICIYMAKLKPEKEEDILLRNLGLRIANLRKSAGYKNQEEFAHEVGIARGQYSRYEAGSNITLTSLYKILKFHKMSVKDFFSEGF
jgi:transcriptional regulator with XRE-family HTH domain